MKLVAAPNALKGSCSASAAAAALAAGARRAAPGAEVVEVPVADGGDGLLEVAVQVLGAERVPVAVTGPRFTPLAAEFGWLPRARTAIVELALASGLARLPPAQRDPCATTSLGTGELMRRALDLGAETLIVGLGGSATNDGGIGMAQALGYRLLDASGAPVEPVGGALARIARIDPAGVDPRLARVRVEAVCDVDNPLLGARGAAAVYGPQKGAGAGAIARLDAGLARLAAVLERDLGVAVAEVPGAGAAGGLGAGLLAFCEAALRPGAEVVLDLIGFDRHLDGADLVLTAEGRIDAQSGSGKAPGAVAARARRRALPCIAIAGGLDDEARSALHALGFDALFSLCCEPMTLAEAERRSEELLAAAAEQAVRAFLAGRRAAPAAQPPSVRKGTSTR